MNELKESKNWGKIRSKLKIKNRDKMKKMGEKNQIWEKIEGIKKLGKMRTKLKIKNWDKTDKNN